MLAGSQEMDEAKLNPGGDLSKVVYDNDDII
jgi:hypothetical protein